MGYQLKTRYFYKILSVHKILNKHDKKKNLDTMKTINISVNRNEIRKVLNTKRKLFS